MNLGPANDAAGPDSDQRRLVGSAFAQFERIVARAGGTKLPGGCAVSIPGYRLLGEIHRGGQGVVYQAIQESTQRKMAIKVLKEGPFADPIDLARFEREIDVLGRLNHPHIVAMRDRGMIAGHAYYVMDFIAGTPLDAHGADDPRSIDEVLRLFVKVCDAVTVAHLRGVIHRDLKPGNIRVDDQGEPRILDFGLAKIVRDIAHPAPLDAMTITGQFIGSLPWSSPEQVTGNAEDTDVRTDVYSLGVILYQLVTGRFPYPVTGRIDDVVRNITTTSPARPSTIVRGIDRDIDIILLTCLAKEPGRRYQSVGELARDIRRYLAHEPVLAAPPSAAYKLRKFARRHRVFVLAGAILGATLVAGAIATAVQSARATREAEQSRALFEFLREVLTSVDPENRGADVRLVHVLAEASGAASERFQGYPSREAEVRDLLGRVYDRLSMWGDAHAEYARAVELYRGIGGPDDSRTLAAQAGQLSAAISMGLTDTSERILSELTPRLVRLFGPDDPRTLSARRAAAVTLLQRGRADEAEAILLQLRAHPGLEHDDEAQSRLLSALLAVHKHRLSTDDAAERHAVLEHAEPLALEWIERTTRRDGPHAVSSLMARVAWADLACQLGEYRTAADTCLTILDGSAARMGECHYVRLNAMYILAESFAQLGRHAEAAELILRRIGCQRQILPTDGPAFLSSVSDSLRYLERAGCAAEGESLARELSNAIRKFGGGHGDIAFMSHIYIAHFTSMQHRLDEAESLFESVRADEPHVSEARVRARMHVFYGGHLTRCARYEEAESQLDEAAHLAGGLRVGTWNTHPDDIVQGYIALYEAWNKPEKAVGMRRLLPTH